MSVWSPSFLNLVRRSLQRVTDSTELDPNDSAVRELKSSVLRIMAEREIRKASNQNEQDEAATKDSAA